MVTVYREVRHGLKAHSGDFGGYHRVAARRKWRVGLARYREYE